MKRKTSAVAWGGLREVDWDAGRAGTVEVHVVGVVGGHSLSPRWFGAPRPWPWPSLGCSTPGVNEGYSMTEFFPQRPVEW